MGQTIGEFFLRLRTTSPKFFKGLQWVIGIVTALLGLLTFLNDNQLVNFAPQWLQTYLGSDSVIMGVIMYIMAKLPVDNPDDLKK